MRKRKNSKVVHADIFIITCICVLVIWFDPTVECQIRALRWMRSDMAFQSEYLETRVNIGFSNSVPDGVYSFDKYFCYSFFIYIYKKQTKNVVSILSRHVSRAFHTYRFRLVSLL